jgi:hypothetical protein
VVSRSEKNETTNLEKSTFINIWGSKSSFWEKKNFRYEGAVFRKSFYVFGFKARGFYPRFFIRLLFSHWSRRLKFLFDFVEIFHGVNSNEEIVSAMARILQKYVKKSFRWNLKRFQKSILVSMPKKKLFLTKIFRCHNLVKTGLQCLRLRNLRIYSAE